MICRFNDARTLTNQIIKVQVEIPHLFLFFIFTTMKRKKKIDRRPDLRNGLREYEAKKEIAQAPMDLQVVSNKNAIHDAGMANVSVLDKTSSTYKNLANRR